MANILLVDPFVPFRRWVCHLLSWMGHHIGQAGSMAEAWECIRQCPPDLILLELHLPDGNGLALSRQVRTDPGLAETLLFCATTSSRDEDIRLAIAAGCDDYYLKPLEDASLMQNVQRALGRAALHRPPRIPASLEVSFEDSRGIFIQYARNLSRTGIFVEMSKPLPRGTLLRLSFALPGPTAKAIVVYGRVEHSSPAGPAGPDGERSRGGMGIRFICLDEDAKRQIDSLVHASGQGLDMPLATSCFGRTPDDAQGESTASPASRVAILEGRKQCRSHLEALQIEFLNLSAQQALTEGILGAGSTDGQLKVLSGLMEQFLGVCAFSLTRFQGPGGAGPRHCFGLELPGAIESQQLVPALDPLLASSEGQIYWTPHPIPGTEHRTLAAVPLAGQGHPVGLLAVHALAGHRPILTPVDLDRLGALARLLGRDLAQCIVLAGT